MSYNSLTLVEIHRWPADVSSTMAQLALRIPDNVPGDFFVDSSCIDCDACRQIAPGVFHDAGSQSAVHHQPENDDELLAAQKALIACPTASIGSATKHDMRRALDAYPELIDDDVYRCGYTSESSFGAFSYLIRRDGANILIDSPRFAGPLVKRIDAMGGVRRMLLTHQDDVADHEKFHQRFGCERVIHRDDARTRTASVELKPSGSAPIELEPGLLMIPTPGHTKGHSVFLYRDKFLFTGDHLAWDADDQMLYAFRGACWYSWTEQISSMERLLDYRFEWVLPGHGRPIRLPADQMHESLARCVAWMKNR
ncbi:MAG TPA: MBL fold metallo-hydrolase [Thermoanaerobaculia bacterium]